MEIQATCSRCGASHQIDAVQSVNAKTQAELASKVRGGELFTWTCPHCGTVNLVKFPFLYHDPEEKLMLVLTDSAVNADGLPDGYTGRLVGSVGDLLEKIKIFDTGLDDIVIEMCKFVTVREMGKDLQLRFLKLDGADSEMTFTYPDNGQMQMLAVGFNVYEDCAGIVRRNPAIRQAAGGLVKVDSDWLAHFFA